MHGHAPKPLLLRLQARLSARSGRPPGGGEKSSEQPGPRRPVWALALPVLFAELGQTLIEITDTAFLGRVGTTELAALGIVDAMVDVWLVPAIGLVEAMQIVVARRVGEQREAAAGAVFARTLLLVGVVSLALAALLRSGAGPLTTALLDSPAVAVAVEDFFRYGAWGIAVLSLNLAYSSLYVGLGRARILIAATLVLTVVNLVLSYGLIFGELGLPRLGIEGAGLGFLGAELATFGLLTVHTLRRGPLATRLGDGSTSVPPVRSLLRLGTPIALQALVEALRWFGFFFVVGRMGTQALAWSTLVYGAYAVFLIPSGAFGDATYSLTSRLIGQGRAEQVRPLLRAITLRAMLATLPLLVPAVLVPEAVLFLLTDDEGLVHGAEGSLRVLALGMACVVVADIWLAGLFGTGDVDAGFFVELLLSVTVVGVAALSGLALGLALPFVWLIVPVASLAAFVLSSWWLGTGRSRPRPL